MAEFSPSVVAAAILGLGLPALFVAAERQGLYYSFDLRVWAILRPLLAALVGGSMRGREWALLYPLAYAAGNVLASGLWARGCVDPRSSLAFAATLCPQYLPSKLVGAMVLVVLAILGAGARWVVGVVWWRVRWRDSESATLAEEA